MLTAYQTFLNNTREICLTWIPEVFRIMNECWFKLGSFYFLQQLNAFRVVSIKWLIFILLHSTDKMSRIFNLFHHTSKRNGFLRDQISLTLLYFVSKLKVLRIDLCSHICILSWIDERLHIRRFRAYFSWGMWSYLLVKCWVFECFVKTFTWFYQIWIHIRLFYDIELRPHILLNNELMLIPLHRSFLW